MAKTARQTVLDLLIKLEKSGSYSNIALDAALSQGALDRREKAFATALFYGVLERKIALDAVIGRYARQPLSKMSLEVICILRMGIYQLLYMDKVPDSAAVNESVALSDYIRNRGAKGFINAVLRSFIRDGKKLILPDKENNFTQYASLCYACPEWLVEKWTQEYDAAHTEGILAHSLGRPPLTLRVNTLAVTAQALLEELTREGVTASLHPFVPDCILIEKSGDIEVLPAYQHGLFHVQDIASQLCCLALGAKPGEYILDVCAAPGGKSFTTAMYMQNRGRLRAFDLYPKRTKLIAEGAARLGLSVISPEEANAAEYHPEFAGADRVLCDVPCSGLGVIRRKPEIKYKAPKELERLPEIQAAILQNASRYVRPGGTLLYSTCALSKEENEENALRFLEQNKEFVPCELPELCRQLPGCEGNMATFFPDELGSDGFFISLFQRK